MTPPWLHFIETCPSTNRLALDRAGTLAHGDAIFTRHQTAGRGQRDRVWHAPPGVITVSYVFHGLSIEQLAVVSFTAGLAILDTIDELAPDVSDASGLKWTNDILIQDRKVAGILCERRSSLPQTVVIGIGFNRSVTFEPSLLQSLLLPSSKCPMSLHEVVAVLPDDLTIVAHVRQHLLDRIAEPNPQRILQCLKSRDILQNRTIEFEYPDGRRIMGIARGLSDRGELRLEVGDRIETHGSGRVLNWGMSV